MAPATLLVDRLGALPLGPGKLQLSNPAGRIWSGQADWRWQRLAGELSWSLDWRGLTPGLSLDLREDGDRLRIAGWFSPGYGNPQVRDLAMEVPVELIAEEIPHGSGDGTVSGRISEVVWAGDGFSALSGELRYSGGQVRWGSDGSAQVPPLDGRLYMEDSEAMAVVTGPEGQRMAEARLAGDQLHFRVYRAWPALLGESRGGSPDDVVFEVTRPLPGGGGQQ